MRGLALAFLILAFAALQAMLGGTRSIYALPGFILVALAGLTAIFPFQRPSRSVSLTALLAALLFIGYVVIRNRLSDIEYLGRLQLLIAAGCLVLYLFTALFLSEPRQRLILFTGLCVLAITQVVVGWIQFQAADGWMPLPWFQRLFTGGWRASGFFITGNHLAGFLEVVAPFALSLVLWSRLGTAVKVLLANVVLLCLAGVTISGSRGGAFSLGLALVAVLGLSLWGCHRLYREKFPIMAAAFALLLVLLALPARSLINQDIVTRFASMEENSEGRTLLWEAALQQFALQPALGTGGFTSGLYWRLFRDPSIQKSADYVHNDYLQLLAEYGAMGAGLFLLVLGVHLVVGFRNLRAILASCEERHTARSNQLALLIGALGSLAAYLGHSALDFNMHIPANALLMAFAFGILAGPSVQRSGSSPARWPSLLLGRIVLPASSLALLLTALAWLPGEWWGEQARRALRDKDLFLARDSAQLGLDQEKSNPDLSYYAGESCRLLGVRRLTSNDPDNLAAETHFRKALALYPQDTRSVLALALTQAQLRRFDEAQETIDLAEELDPVSATIPAHRGAVKHLEAQYAEAWTYYEEALALDGSNTLARHGLDILRKAKIKAPR